MALPDKVEAVQKVTETLSKQSANPVEEVERVAPNKEHFQSLMSQSTHPDQHPTTKPLEEIQKIENNPILGHENVSAQKSGTATDQERKRQQQSGIEEIESVKSSKASSSSQSSSLMDEVTKLNKNVSQISHLDPQSIQTQAKDIITQLEQAKTQLSQTQAEIKPSYQTLLRNRLSHIDDNLKIALSKAGIEYTPSAPTPTEKVNPIQQFIRSLTNSQQQMENLDLAISKMKGTEISPVDMLALQMKVGHVQQQIELFTSLLNKALESTKTIMNVQV
jgi:hypothetical protein